MNQYQNQTNPIIRLIKDLKNHGGFFALVGVLAALVHYFTFVWFIRWMWPEIANIFGFLSSFMISFIGHRYFTFNDHNTSLVDSLLRFFSTACLGFANNEMVLAFLHRFLHLDSKIALVIGMVTAAAQTFLLSRYWAFQKTQSPQPSQPPHQS